MSENNSSGRVTSIYDVVIILAVLATISWLSYLIIVKFPKATEAATLIGVIFPSITAIVMAAFGISQVARANKAEDKAEDKADKVVEKDKKLKQVNSEVTEIKKLLETPEKANLQFSKSIGDESDVGTGEVESLRNRINKIDLILDDN